MTKFGLKKKNGFCFSFILNYLQNPFVPREGLEPSRPCEQQILSLPCLPFHHQGIFEIVGKDGFWCLSAEIVAVKR